MSSTTHIEVLPGPAEAPAGPVASVAQRQVWDLPLRIFHWALVTAFITSYVTNKLGIAWFKYHVWSGYAVLVLVGFRILWGLVGTRHARFGSFVRGPSHTIRYALDVVRGRASPSPGHNPLGALMVLALLLTLLAQALSGLFSNDEIADVGPLYGYVSNARSLQLTSLHRLLFDWIFAAVVLHVLAVLLHGLLGKEKLVRAMLTGRKPAHSVPQGQAIGSSRLWLALTLLLALGLALAWIVSKAPLPDLQAY